MYSQWQQAQPPLRQHRFASLNRERERRSKLYTLQSRRQDYQLPYIISQNQSPTDHLAQKRTKFISNYTRPFDVLNRDFAHLKKANIWNDSSQLGMNQSRYKAKTEATEQLDSVQSRGRSVVINRKSKPLNGVQQKDQGFRLWRNPDLIRNRELKVYRIKPKRVYEQQISREISLSEYPPIIDQVKIGRGFGNRKKEYFYQYLKSPTNHQSPYLKIAYKRRQRLARIFKKISHAVLFIAYLKTYNQRMRRARFHGLQNFINDDIHQNLIELKSCIIDSSRPFFQTLVNQYEFDFSLYEKDDIKLKKEKVSVVKQLIDLQMQCLDKCIRSIVNRQQFAQTLYYLCKHGSFATFYELMTKEELNLISVSQNYGYLRGDKHIQRSAILSLIFVKILLFNIFLQPNKISIFDNLRDKNIIFKNIKLIGNILYELMGEVQNHFLEKVPPIYSLGNWAACRASFPIKTAESMTLRPGYFQDELISGLAEHKFIKQVYGIAQMISYKKLLQNLVKQLHENIVAFHQRVQRKHF